MGLRRQPPVEPHSRRLGVWNEGVPGAFFDRGARPAFRARCYTIGKTGSAWSCYTIVPLPERGHRWGAAEEMPEIMETLLDAGEVQRVLRRMASTIVEATGGADELALVGVRRGGVALSRRLAGEIEVLEGKAVDVGAVDIAFYRDDAATALPDPKIGPSDVPFSVAGRDVIIVDDVLQTGRTIRAAIECLLDYGRPRRIWLAVLLDRDGRELPIAADFVGRKVEVPSGAKVRLILGETASADDRAALEHEG